MIQVLPRYLCPRCKGDTVIPIKRDGKRVGVMVCPECGGRGEKPVEAVRAAVRSVALAIGLAAAAVSACEAADPWRATICRPGYSAALRLPIGRYEAMRDVAFRRAGIPVSLQCHRNDPRPDCYILDHILPLELCTENCNDPSNLQVQRRADAEAKDHEEDLAHWRYCEARSETLAEARSHFHRSVP